jgi:hypothetical protein
VFTGQNLKFRKEGNALIERAFRRDSGGLLKRTVIIRPA